MSTESESAAADSITKAWEKDYADAIDKVAPNGVVVALGESDLDSLMLLCAELAASATILYHKCAILNSITESPTDTPSVGQFKQAGGDDFKQGPTGS